MAAPRFRQLSLLKCFGALPVQDADAAGQFQFARCIRHHASAMPVAAFQNHGNILRSVNALTRVRYDVCQSAAAYGVKRLSRSVIISSASARGSCQRPGVSNVHHKSEATKARQQLPEYNGLPRNASQSLSTSAATDALAPPASGDQKPHS